MSAEVAICPQKAKHAAFNSFVVTLSCLRNGVWVGVGVESALLPRRLGIAAFLWLNGQKGSTLSLGCLKGIAAWHAAGKAELFRNRLNRFEQIGLSNNCASIVGGCTSHFCAPLPPPPVLMRHSSKTVILLFLDFSLNNVFEAALWQWAARQGRRA